MQGRLSLCLGIPVVTVALLLVACGSPEPKNLSAEADFVPMNDDPVGSSGSAHASWEQRELLAVERAVSARTAEDMRAAQEALEALRREVGAVGRDRTELVAFSDALAWWRRPLLRSHARDETVVIRSILGGRRGSPRSSGSQVTLWYGLNGRPADEYFERIAAGAIAITATFYANEAHVQFQRGATWRPQVLRRTPGGIDTYTQAGGSNVDWRNLQWVERDPAGGVVLWEVGMSSSTYSERESIAFAENLVFVQPADSGQAGAER